MAGNPQVALGTLNKVQASVVYTTFPTLNVTASNLTKAGITLSFQGNYTELLPTMTGTVPSPEPYVQAELTINILKSQGLSDQYKQQLEANGVIGDLLVVPDASTLSNYNLTNCAIMSVRDLNFAGTEPGMQIVIQGSYFINNDLWSAV
jgi:hypothetical protein